MIVQEEVVVNEKVLLNIGGAVFTTSPKTLTKIPGSYLANLFTKPRNSYTPYEYFVDRNVNRFDVILEHLRGEDVSHIFERVRESDVEDIRKDVIFYGITTMRKYFRSLRIEDEENAKKANMVKGSFNGIKEGVLQGHEEYVRCMIMLKNGRLASGSADKTIKVWDIKNKTCEYTLDAGGEVRSLCELQNGNLACRVNETLVVYDLKNKIKFKTLANMGTFDLLDLKNGTFALYGHGDDVRILDYDCVEVGRLRGNSGDYSHPGMALLSGNRAVTYNYYQKIELWDLQTFSCIKSWKDTKSSGNLSGLSSFEGSKFIAVRDYECAKVMDADTEEILFDIGDKNVISEYVTVLSDGTIASLSKNQYIKVYDRTGTFKTGIEHAFSLSYLCAVPDGGVASVHGSRHNEIHVFA